MKKFTLVDLFAGCGGLSLGFELAGFKPVLFSEINKDAASTYKANRCYDIIENSDIYKLSESYIRKIRAQWAVNGIDNIDVLAGGPPCQGFSRIGHRRTFNLAKKDIPSNQLYHEMARVIKAIRPKIFLFENVSGLLGSRWTANGVKGEIFKDVYSTLSSIKGYTVSWELVHAKNYGVPQNRPRVLIVGLRNDLSLISRHAIKPHENIIEPNAINLGFLPKPDYDYPNLHDLLSDLCDPDFKYGGSIFKYNSKPKNTIQKLLRTRPDGSMLELGDDLTDHEFSNHSERIRKKFAYMIANNGQVPSGMDTKKFFQKVLPKQWGPDGPNITACSMPDDFVHFSQPRSLTVREWARLQTFPDWYVFKGPRTTGGRRRAGDPAKNAWERAVPKYTQIGNAVPVELARKIAMHFKHILS